MLYQGRGGTSAETRAYGFRPAFLDTQTGTVYPCCFSDGRPAPMHLFDGLPAELIVSHSPCGRAVSVKGSIVSGFVRGEQFYTREEASKQLMPPSRLSYLDNTIDTCSQNSIDDNQDST